MVLGNLIRPHSIELKLDLIDQLKTLKSENN